MTTLINPLTTPEASRDATGRLAGLPAPAGFLLLILVWLLGYHDSLAWMMAAWLNHRGHYGHGLLVLGLVAWLLWEQRKDLAGERPGPWATPCLLAATAGLSAVWFCAAAVGLRVPGALSAIAVAWLALGFALGQGGWRRLLPHLALILSVVPIWQPVFNPPLQALATCMVNRALRALGLTLYVDGNTIVMPDVIFEIVGGCSGLGFALVAFTLSIFLAVSHRLRMLPGVLLLLAFLGLAIFTNWLRIALIMLVGYFEGPTHPLVHDHLWFGWGLFCVVLLPTLFLVVRRLPMGTVPASAPAPMVSRGALATVIAAVALAPMLYHGLHLAARLAASESNPLTANVNSLYSRSEIPDNSLPAWAPMYPGATFTELRVYRSLRGNSAPVRLFQAHYAYQTDTAEVIDGSNDLVGPGWTQVGQRRDATRLDGERRPVRELELRHDASGERMLLWFWYRIGPSHQVEERRAKLAQLIWKLRLRSDAALIALGSRCGDADCADARQTLAAFAPTLMTSDAPGVGALGASRE
jgi:EpsI family protein